MYLLLISGLQDSHLLQAFCWMLIHSLWQGLLFTVITAMVLQLTTRLRAAVRYNLVSALLFAFIAVCLFTFLHELYGQGSQVKELQQASATNAGTTPLLYFMFGCIDYLSIHAWAIALFWFVVFCIKTARLITALMYHKHVKDHTTLSPEDWRNRLGLLCERLQIKKTVQLLESELVKIPVVIGHLKPVIFIPAGLLTNLPPGEVEGVLLHELAHIRRNDYLVNMVQVITESIFFFNPALLWMSNVLREERENCCDDIAIQHSKSKKQYLQALVSFQEHALLAPGFAPPFYTGRNQMLKRVTRIVSSRNHTLDAIGKKFFVVSCILLALLLVTVKNADSVFQPAKRGVKARLVHASEPVLSGSKSVVSRVNNGNINEHSSIVRTVVSARLKPFSKVQVRRRKTVLTHVVEQKVVNLTGNANIEYVTKSTVYVTNSLATEQQQEVMSRLQAEKDREQADKDRRRADLDRLQAQKDREQAERDKQQAVLDRDRADKDRQQAEKDRQRANKERLYYQSQKAII